MCPSRTPCSPQPGSPWGTRLSTPPGAPHGSLLQRGEKELSEASGLFLSSAGSPAPAPNSVPPPLAPPGSPGALREVP